MTAIEHWERRLGVRQDLRGVFVRWDADPGHPNLAVEHTGGESELREMSVSGAAIVAPFDPSFAPDTDVTVAHGDVSGRVRIRRVEKIGLDDLRLYAVEFTDPDPSLANALYPFLDSPASGDLLETWHGRYVD